MINVNVPDILKPVAELVDKVTTTDEERLKIKLAMAKTEAELYKSVLQAQSKAVVMEATGRSWLQRNWRPITMLVFLALVVFDSFGWLPNRLAPEAWTVLKIGIGGYVIGRSGEKIAAQMSGK